SLLKCNWTIRKRLPRCKMRLKKRLLAFSRRLHARIRKTRYMHKMRCLQSLFDDLKSVSAGMPRPMSYPLFCFNEQPFQPITYSASIVLFKYNDATFTSTFALSLHDALPI